MAFNTISQVELTNGGSTVDGTTYSTASFTPTVGKPVVAFFVHSRSGSNTPSVPTSVVHSGLLFGVMGNIGSSLFTGTGGTDRRLEVWAGLAAAATADTLDFTFPETQQNCQWYVCELTDVDTNRGISLGIIDFATGSGTAEQSFDTADNPFGAAADAGTRYMAAFAQTDIASGINNSVGWTELIQRSLGAPAVMFEVQAIFNAQDNTPTATNDSATNVNWGGIAIEIAATVAPDPSRVALVAPSLAATQASSW